MNYVLTQNYQYSKRCNDGKNRNFLTFFLNDVEIFKQKIPFDTRFERGFDRRTGISNIYILVIYTKLEYLIFNAELIVVKTKKDKLGFH